MLFKVAKVVKVFLTVFTDMYFLQRFLAVLRKFFCIEMKRADVLLQGAFPCVGLTTMATHMWLLH